MTRLPPTCGDVDWRVVVTFGTIRVNNSCYLEPEYIRIFPLGSGLTSSGLNWLRQWQLTKIAVLKTAIPLPALVGHRPIRDAISGADVQRRPLPTASHPLGYRLVLCFIQIAVI